MIHPCDVISVRNVSFDESKWIYGDERTRALQFYSDLFSMSPRRLSIWIWNNRWYLLLRMNMIAFSIALYRLMSGRFKTTISDIWNVQISWKCIRLCKAFIFSPSTHPNEMKRTFQRMKQPFIVSSKHLHMNPSCSITPNWTHTWT